MRLSLQKISKLVALLLWILPYTASASQIKIAADGAEIVGKISKAEINRITLIGDKVKSVKSNKGGYEFSNDSSSGDVYLNGGNGGTEEPLNVFIISQRGYTYKLLLTPMDIPSEQIFIKNHAITNDEEVASQREPLPYTQEIVDLFKAMKKGDLEAGYTVKTLSESHFAKNGMKIMLLSTYTGSKYTGIIYELKNKGTEPVPLSEKDFATKKVRAVKFDSTVIGAGETINIYIVADRS